MNLYGAKCYDRLNSDGRNLVVRLFSSSQARDMFVRAGSRHKQDGNYRAVMPEGRILSYYRERIKDLTEAQLALIVIATKLREENAKLKARLAKAKKELRGKRCSATDV